jgi:hypothetical protein
MKKSRGASSAGLAQRVCALQFAVLSVVILALLLGSCGSDKARYGVVLLSPNEDALSTGSTVRLTDRSDINETYTVTSSDSDERFEIATWRVKGFTDSSKAEQYAREYAPNVNLYANNLHDGLAVREEPDIDSPRVYKLRKGQKIKILEKAKAETIGSHAGHWYRVLTTDGTAGYCFDHYLEIYDTTNVQEESEDPDITRLREKLSRTYRPAGFRSMMEAGHIKLDQFDPQYGLFTELEENSIRIRMFEYTHTFTFEEIEKEGPDTFTLAGAGVQVQLKAEDEIQLVYTKENRNYATSFVYIDQETIETRIKEERERRQKAYSRLQEAGPVFNSSAYGRIEFSGEGGLRWERYDRLVPRVIPGGSSGSGTVRFNHFLAEPLKNKYEGAFSLTLGSYPDQPLVFMYRLEEGKLNLEYVPGEKIKGRVIQERASYPLIMVFFAAGQQS